VSVIIPYRFCMMLTILYWQYSLVRSMVKKSSATLGMTTGLKYSLSVVW